MRNYIAQQRVKIRDTQFGRLVKHGYHEQEAHQRSGIDNSVEKVFIKGTAGRTEILKLPADKERIETADQEAHNDRNLEHDQQEHRNKRGKKGFARGEIHFLSDWPSGRPGVNRLFLSHAEQHKADGENQLNRQGNSAPTNILFVRIGGSPLRVEEKCGILSKQDRI